MTELSVIIVNYNVKYFLEQCLYSVRSACKGIAAEVLVVDNNSVDGSDILVKQKFPEVHYIANTVNAGFSKANNQALKIAKGRYVLLLNPDTVIQEDTLKKCLEFMEEHPDCGGLGVKMVDGKGNFLPESKRGLPTPEVAFYKISGLAKLFPHSRRFGKYHLSYLNANEIHEVEILSGAFMFMRKAALDKVGVLDEDFFMYGEDIDLSYRLIKGGYKNYYFPQTRIIHYKGESTKKGSMNYVFMFYNAMLIFAKKHFSKRNLKLFSLLINAAVYFRAFLALLKRVIEYLFIPVTDFVLTFLGLLLITIYWSNTYIESSYPKTFIIYFLPAYAFIWLISIFLSGGYDKPYRFSKLNRGILIGTIMILSGYSLLNEGLRFSRFIILSGAVFCFISTNSIRWVLGLLFPKTFPLGTPKNKRYLITGSREETERVKQLLYHTNATPGFVGLVSSSSENFENGLGHIHQLKEISLIYQINEIIFCSKDLSAKHIIDRMSDLQDLNIDFKIAPQAGDSIIGSNSINTSGELYTIAVNPITRFENRRNKRLLDFSFSILIILTSPYLIFRVKRPAILFKNIFKVLIGKKSWVGFDQRSFNKLPHIKSGILKVTDTIAQDKLSQETIANLNLLYAHEYSVKTDLNIIAKCYSKLGG